VKRIFVFLLASIGLATVCTAQTSQLGWPEVIARLTHARAQVETCVGMIKSSKNASVIAPVKTIYEMTTPRVEGAVAGLVAALVEGGNAERRSADPPTMAWRRAP
jgi:hypothetical protein